LLRNCLLLQVIEGKIKGGICRSERKKRKKVDSNIYWITLR
jgi:hypothetical protein